MADTPKKLGRSLLAEETTVDEIRTLTKAFTVAKHYIHDEMTGYAYDSVVVDGDLTIDGDLDTFAHGICRLVVTGNLTVAGTYGDYDDPETAVFVLGDFEARNAITNGALCVAGDVTVREAFIGYYNDHSAEIHGAVTTTLFAPENHHFSIDGKLHATYVVGHNTEYRVSPRHKQAASPTPPSRWPELLVPEVLSIGGAPEDTDLRHRELMTRVARGLPVLRVPSVAPTRAKAKPAKTKPTKTKPTKTKTKTTKARPKAKPPKPKPVKTKPTKAKRAATARSKVRKAAASSRPAKAARPKPGRSRS